MRAASYVICCWPGLYRLWVRGQWSGLAIAACFTLVFNLALAASLLDPPWIRGLIAWSVWISVGGWWLLGFVLSHRQTARAAAGQFDDSASDVNEVDLFPQAQSEYLREHWIEAERLLKQAIQQRPNDVDARLLLATLLRRMDRLPESRRELQNLEKTAGAEKWSLEIFRERELLERDAEEQDETAANTQAA